MGLGLGFGFGVWVWVGLGVTCPHMKKLRTKKMRKVTPG